MSVQNLYARYPTLIAIACLSGRVLELTKRLLASKGLQLPGNIAFQTDNTTREQRNSWGLLFGAWLVGQRVMRTSDQVFYRVGHTHNEVDQRFWILGSTLAKQKTLSTPQDRVLPLQ